MQLLSLFVATTALALASSVATADIACTRTQTSSAFTAFASILSNPDFNTCSMSSGFNMLYATAVPDDDQKLTMCGLPSCHALNAIVISKNPPNCVLTIPTSGAEWNVYAMANAFEADCTRLMPTTATPAPTTATPTPAPTTTTPTTATPTTVTPQPTMATPTPTTTTLAPTGATPAVTTTTPAVTITVPLITIEC